MLQCSQTRAWIHSKQTGLDFKTCFNLAVFDKTLVVYFEVWRIGACKHLQHWCFCTSSRSFLSNWFTIAKFMKALNVPCSPKRQTVKKSSVCVCNNGLDFYHAFQDSPGTPIYTITHSHDILTVLVTPVSQCH